MELVLTSEEHAALPEDRRSGAVEQEDGIFLIRLDRDPLVELATVNRT